MTRRARRLLPTLATVVVAVTACADDSTTGPVGSGARIAPGQTVAQAIGPSGGTVALASTEGASFTLTIPAGALTEEQTVRITTDTAIPGQRFNVVLAPAGLRFAGGARATIHVELPGTFVLPATGGVVYAGVPVDYTREPDGRLVVRLPSFAAAPAASASPDPVVVASDGAAAPCGGDPATSGYGFQALIGVEEMQTTQYTQCMSAAVQRLTATGAYEDAVRASLAIAALLQFRASQGAVAQQTIAQALASASTAACTAQRLALDNALATVADDWGKFRSLVRPILFWQQIVQQLGATCANVGTLEYRTVIDAKAEQLAVFYDGLATPSLRAAAAARESATPRSVARITDVSDPLYAQAISEARGHQETVDQVRSVPAGDSVKSYAVTRIGGDVQASLLEEILEAPFRACRNTGSYAELIELMGIMDGPQAVRTAAQYCGTQLDAESRTSGNSTLETLVPTLGGASATDQITLGALRVELGGTIRLSGPIRRLQCPAGSAGGSEQLELRLGNTVLQTLGSAPYLSGVLELSVDQMLQAAGITPASFTNGVLGVYRTGTPCGGFWGSAPAPLLRLNLSAGVCVPSAGLPVCVTLIETATALPFSERPRLQDFNSKGQVLLEVRYSYGRCATSDGGAPAVEPCSAVWRAGTMTNLPHRILGIQIADDGTVGGNEQVDGGLVHPTVVAPDHATAVRLATSSARSNTGPAFAPDGRLYRLATLSRDGTRATYGGGDEGSARLDAGYCDSASTPGLWDCAREEWFTADRSSPGGGWVSTSRFSSARPLPFTKTSAYHDAGRGQGGGIIGAFLDLPSGTGRPMLDFSGRATAYYPIVRSENGFELNITASGGEIYPNGVPSYGGFVPAALGPVGHLLACTDTDARVLDLRTADSVLVTMPRQFTYTVQGQQHVLAVPCGVNQFNEARRWVDDRGRILVRATSSTSGRTIGAILTPAGVPLP